LARVRFSFSKQKSKAFGYVARPIIKLALRAGGGEVFETTALLDSGADISMLSPSVAEIMGINLREGRRRVFRGLGGEIEAYHIRARKLLNLFMEMNCGDTFACLPGLNAIS